MSTKKMTYNGWLRFADKVGVYAAAEDLANRLDVAEIRIATLTAELAEARKAQPETPKTTQ